MDALSSNVLLQFNPNQLMEVRKIFGYDDLNRLQQDIDILKNWIQKQEHFTIKQNDEAYLELHLIFSKGSVERAKKHIDKLCTLRGLMPEYLQKFDIENEFNNLLNVTYTCVFPKPTPDNYRLLFTNFHNPDAAKYEPKDMARYMLVIVEYLHRYDYITGLEIVCDVTNITLGIISKLSPIIIANVLMIITEALGLRVKGLHFLLGSKFMDAVLGIMKTALSKKLTSRLHVHESYEAMFKFIPKDVFPKDLGGDFPDTLKEINVNNLKAFSSLEFMKKMKNIENAVTDESKRLRSKFNEDYSGMPGSFKVLSVD